MSTFGSSPSDEYGTGGTNVTFRDILNIADDKGDYYLMKTGITTVIRRVALTVTKPIILRADEPIRFIGNIAPWFFTIGANTMFSTFPLKKGNISGFSDNTTNTLVTTVDDHNLKVNDVVRIIDSRVTDYDGEFIISSVPTSGSFTIEVTFNGVDGECSFSQYQIYITTMADSVTSPGVKITLSMQNHGLDEDISINITESTNGINGNYIISNVTTDTVDILGTFTVTGTGDVDVGIRNVEFIDESIVPFPPNPNTSIFDLDVSDIARNTSLLVESSVFGGANMGEVRGIGGLIISENSALINCTGLDVINIGFINIRDTAAIVMAPNFSTASYAPCIRIAPAAGTPGQNFRTVTLSRNDIGFRDFESFVEIPQIIDSNTSISVVENSDASPGTLYSLGYVARTDNSAITDAGGGNITIPISDTMRFRVGDDIEILESTNYTGQTGTIQSIISSTSITVDIAFVAGDTQILLRDNTLASKGSDDIQVTSVTNAGLANSTITANSTLPYDAALVVTISSVNVPVVIGGTWNSSELERIEFNSSGGIFTYIGLVTQKLLINFGATITGNASNFFAIHIFLNGIDVTDAPPIVDIINANTGSTIGGAQIILLEEGDTLQLAISNLTNTQDPTVHQAHVTVTQI